MKKKITSLLASIALTLGAIVGFGVVAAPSASAVTYNSCFWSFSNPGWEYCYLDYSWGEEVFGGHRDGWYRSYGGGTVWYATF